MKDISGRYVTIPCCVSLGIFEDYLVWVASSMPIDKSSTIDIIDEKAYDTSG